MGTIGAAPSPPGASRRGGWIVAGVLAVIVLALGAYEFGSRGRAIPVPLAVAPTVVAATTRPGPVEAAPSPIPAPTEEPAAEGRVERVAISQPSPPVLGSTASATNPSPAGAITSAAVSHASLPCLDQVPFLLIKLEPLVFEFKREMEIALETARISLAPEVSKLEEIWHRTMLLDEWPPDRCGYRLEERLRAAEAFDVERLKAFMGGSSSGQADKARELWDDAERQLKEMRMLFEATRRR